MVLFHSIASNIIKLQKTRQKLGKNIASRKYYHYLVQTNKNRGIMANIDLKLSSKEDKITHRSEILIRFY